jgi:hypothetical protein
MNHYKEAWLSHAMSDYSPIDNQDKRESESTNSLTDRIVSEVKQDIGARLAFVGLTYMATSHYGKLRIVGSVGLRLLPVIGAAALAYSIYDHFS